MSVAPSYFTFDCSFSRVIRAYSALVVGMLLVRQWSLDSVSGVTLAFSVKVFCANYGASAVSVYDLASNYLLRINSASGSVSRDLFGVG